MKNISDLSPVKQRFYTVFKSTGKTQAEFARILGKSQKLISNILNDRRNVSVDMIQLLKYKFNVNPDFIFHGRTPMFLAPRPTVEPIPLIADIPAGDWRFWYDSYAAGSGEDFIMQPDVKGENLFAIRVEGDSMVPRLSPGDILIVNPHLRFESGIAVVRHDWGYKVRHVRRLAKKKYLLCPFNTAYTDEEITPTQDTRFYVPVKVISVRDI